MLVILQIDNYPSHVFRIEFWTFYHDIVDAISTNFYVGQWERKEALEV